MLSGLSFLSPSSLARITTSIQQRGTSFIKWGDNALLVHRMPHLMELFMGLITTDEVFLIQQWHLNVLFIHAFIQSLGSVLIHMLVFSDGHLKRFAISPWWWIHTFIDTSSLCDLFICLFYKYKLTIYWLSAPSTFFPFLS